MRDIDNGDCAVGSCAAATTGAATYPIASTCAERTETIKPREMGLCVYITYKRWCLCRYTPYHSPGSKSLYQT